MNYIYTQYIHIVSHSHSVVPGSCRIYIYIYLFILYILASPELFLVYVIYYIYTYI